jgi:hypothetical protein
MKISADGHPWAMFIAIAERRPMIRIQTSEVLALNTFGLTGAAQGANDSVVYLRKIEEGGTRVADDTAEHISFTIDEGHIITGPIHGSQGQNLGTEVVITPTYDGTHDVIAISTTAQIVLV